MCDIPVVRGHVPVAHVAVVVVVQPEHGVAVEAGRVHGGGVVAGLAAQEVTGHGGGGHGGCGAEVVRGLGGVVGVVGLHLERSRHGLLGISTEQPNQGALMLDGLPTPGVSIGGYQLCWRSGGEDPVQISCEDLG